MDTLVNNPWPLGLMTLIFLGCVIELGRYTADHAHIQEDPHRKEQMVALRDGMFVLVGLLVGFTLALAAARYAERRSLRVEEANAIGTTYLRAQTLPSPVGDEAQELLKQYVNAKLEWDDAGFDASRKAVAENQTKQIQDRLWKDIVEVTKTDRSAISAAYMNSLNQVIDLDEERVSALENRIPISVWILIFSVSAIAVFTRGLTLVRRFWLTTLLAPLTIAIVVALIADLDTPSRGLIRLDHRALLRLRSDLRKDPSPLTIPDP